MLTASLRVCRRLADRQRVFEIGVWTRNHVNRDELADTDIREVVRTIVTSPEFFSHAAYRAKAKTPFELMASALRVMNAVPASTSG